MKEKSISDDKERSCLLNAVFSFAKIAVFFNMNVSLPDIKERKAVFWGPEMSLILQLLR